MISYSLDGLHFLIELHVQFEGKFLGVRRQVTYDTYLGAICLQDGGVRQVLGGLKLGNLGQVQIAGQHREVDLVEEGYQALDTLVELVVAQGLEFRT